MSEVMSDSAERLSEIPLETLAQQAAVAWPHINEAAMETLTIWTDDPKVAPALEARVRNVLLPKFGLPHGLSLADLKKVVARALNITEHVGKPLEGYPQKEQVAPEVPKQTVPTLATAPPPRPPVTAPPLPPVRDRQNQSSTLWKPTPSAVRPAADKPPAPRPTLPTAPPAPSTPRIQAPPPAPRPAPTAPKPASAAPRPTPHVLAASALKPPVKTASAASLLALRTTKKALEEVVVPQPPAPAVPQPPAPAVPPPLAQATPPPSPIERVCDDKPEVKGVLLSVSVTRLRRFEGQPREEFGEEEQKLLTESLQSVGQLTPALFVQVLDDPAIDYQIVDGERRWISCKQAGIPRLEGVHYPGLSIEDARELFKRSAIANFGRKQHTALESAYVAKQLMRDFGWDLQRTAQAMCRKPYTIDQNLKLLRLVPEVQALMREAVDEKKRIGTQQALKLIDYPEDFQRLIAREISEGAMKGNTASWYVRKRATELGVSKKTKGRPRGRPANDARSLQRAIDRFDHLVTPYIEMSERPLAEVFRSSPTQRQSAIKSLDSLMKRLAFIRTQAVEADSKPR